MNVWVVDYRDGAGVRRRITAASREAAEGLLADKIRENRRAVPAAADREVTLAAYAETLDRYIFPVLGRVKIRALHRGLLKDLLAQRRAQGLSKDTVRLICSVLSVILGDAVDDGIILTNPAPSTGGSRSASRSRSREGRPGWRWSRREGV